MEYFVVALILYVVLRTVANLVRLLQGETGASENPPEQERGRASRRQKWGGPSPRQQTGTAQGDPTFWGKDIEDATWHDLDDPPETNGSSSPNSRRYQTRT